MIISVLRLWFLFLSPEIRSLCIKWTGWLQTALHPPRTVSLTSSYWCALTSSPPEGIRPSSFGFESRFYQSRISSSSVNLLSKVLEDFTHARPPKAPLSRRSSTPAQFSRSWLFLEPVGSIRNMEKRQSTQLQETVFHVKTSSPTSGSSRPTCQSYFSYNPSKIQTPFFMEKLNWNKKFRFYDNWWYKKKT